MNTITISRNNWLLRYARAISGRDDSFYHNLDTCKFAQHVIGETLSLVAAVLFFGSVVSIVVMCIWMVGYWVNSYDLSAVKVSNQYMQLGVEFAIGIVVASVVAFVGFVLYVMQRPIIPWIVSNIPRTTDDQSFVSAVYNSWKHKYCVRMKIED